MALPVFSGSLGPVPSSSGPPIPVMNKAWCGVPQSSLLGWLAMDPTSLSLFHFFVVEMFVVDPVMKESKAPGSLDPRRLAGACQTAIFFTALTRIKGSSV